MKRSLVVLACYVESGADRAKTIEMIERLLPQTELASFTHNNRAAGLERVTFLDADVMLLMDAGSLAETIVRGEIDSARALNMNERIVPPPTAYEPDPRD